MKNIIAFLFLLAITKAGFSQIDILPKTAASPEVAMLDKFQNINISTYTGVPNLNIPLYTIKVDGVEMPIVMSYNSSGIYVGEEATWVGLGWNLSVGGNITQTPVGESDQTDFLTTADYNQLIGTVSTGFNSFSGRSEKGLVWAECAPFQTEDDTYRLFGDTKVFQLGRPDNYSYSIPEGSGKFYLDPITKLPILYGSKKEHVFITHSTSQINGQWIISDLKGVKYIFNLQDQEHTQIFPYKTSFGNLGFGSATWWLSNIFLPSGKQIDFTYIDDNSYTSTKSQTYNRSYLADPPSNNLQTDNSLSQATHYSKKLTIIDTEKEQIVFELSTTKDERADLKEGIVDGIPKRLNAIHIWDKVLHKKIKSFKFSYDYFKGGCPNGTLSYDCARLKLISIQEVGHTSAGVEDLSKPPYQFQYNETNPLPSKQSYAVDFWGYYNGQTSNTGLIPKLSEGVLMGLFDINNFPIEVVKDFYDKGNANRGMDPVYATSGLISKITYPTGGYLQLSYEANDFSNYPIFSAADLDHAQGVNLYKNIEVHDLKICGDELPKQSVFFYPKKDGTVTMLNIQLGFSYLSSIGLEKYGASYVKLYKIDASGTTTLVETWKNMDFTKNPYILNISKLVYAGSPTDKYYFECSLGPDVPCHVGMPGNTPFNGSVSVYFSVFDPNVTMPAYKSIGGGVRIASQETYNQDGTLAFKRNYKYVNSDGSTSGKLMSPLRFHSFRKVANKSETLNPQVFFDGAYLFGISSESYTPLSQDANGAVVGYSRVEVTDVDLLKNTNGKTVYYYRNTPSTTGATELGLPNLPYEDNGLEDAIEIRNSNNDLVMKTINTYSSIEDNLAFGIAMVDNYVGPDRNIVCCGNSGCNNPWMYNGRWSVNYYPLQTRWYTLASYTEYLYSPSPTPVSNEKQISYNNFGQSISESNFGSDGTKLTINSLYPNDVVSPSTLIQSMKTKNLYHLLLNQKQLKNDDSEIWNKEWIYSPTSTNNIKVTTFNQSNLGASPYAVISDVLYDAKDNVIQAKSNGIFTSYVWGYSQTIPVIKAENIDNTTLLTKINESLPTGFTTLDTLLASITVFPNGNWNSFNQTLRSKLDKVMVTTYTYDPLIGMTSSTDPGGLTTYYEYDNFGRLKLVRDKDGKILKQDIYHYQGQ